MNDALVAAPPSSRLREWLRYDESLEEAVDAAFEEFIATSKIVPVFALSYVASFITDVLLYLSYGRHWRGHIELIFAVYYACMYVPAICCLLRVPSKTLRVVLRGAADPRRSAVYAVGVAAAAMIAEFAGAMLLQSVRMYAHERNILEGGVIVAVLAAMISAPIVEESFFQGWLQTRLDRRGTKNPESVTTVLFLLFHLPRTVRSLLRGFGLFANAVVRKETRSLGAPIVAHFTNNFVAVGLLIIVEAAWHRPLHW
jgi:membrane protease YdiL (CAAX protease family)